MTSYEQLMTLAEEYRNSSEHEKDLAYEIFKRTLAWIVRPVSYERAIRELCERMNY